MSEQRRFSRVDFNAKATLGNEGSLWEVEIVDISMNGLLIHRPEHWDAELGDEFDIDIPLGDEKIFIVMRCVVAWVRGDQVGLERLRIGLDSITHLRQLIELNTGDPDLVQREFSQLSFD